VIGNLGHNTQIRDKTVYVSGIALDDKAYAQRIDPVVLEDQINPRDNFAPVAVPEELYFVIGDNRDRSLDSRFFGYVRRSKVMGKIVLIYSSWDQEGSAVQRDRIGQRF